MVCELCKGSGLERFCASCGGFDIDSVYDLGDVEARLCEVCWSAFSCRWRFDPGFQSRGSLPD